MLERQSTPILKEDYPSTESLTARIATRTSHTTTPRNPKKLTKMNDKAIVIGSILFVIVYFIFSED